MTVKADLCSNHATFCLFRNTTSAYTSVCSTAVRYTIRH